MPNKIYTLVVNGKPQGPFTLQELKQFEINANSFIRKPEMDDYKEAHTFPEIRELFNIERQYAKPQYFASFDLRLLASAIDWFTVVSVVLFCELIIAYSFDLNTEILSILISNLVIIPVVKLVYHLLLETKMQATLGKRLLNIKVTDLNGLKPNFNQILGRNSAKIISTAILFLGYFYSFLNKKQQCLHDVIAKTVVIKDRLI